MVIVKLQAGVEMRAEEWGGARPWRALMLRRKNLSPGMDRKPVKGFNRGSDVVRATR